MSKPRILLALLTPLALAACGEAGQSGDMESDTAAAEMDTAAAADTGQQRGALQLEPRNESGITGEAWTEAAPGDSAVIVVELQGLEEGSEYPAHVHEGRCEGGGGVAAALSPVTGGADGSGTSRTTLATAQFSEADPYFVQVHLSDGTPAACANVPQASPDSAAAGGEEEM